MPDMKITRARLRDHFRRLWAAYLVGVVLLCFLNHLVFTVTRPGFSDDETLKIMLLNVDPPLDETALFTRLQAAELSFRAVETESLAYAQADDSTAVMLLSMKLTAGYGDIYLTDRTGLDALAQRGACLALDGEIPGFAPAACTDPETGETYTGALERDGLYMVVAKNTTDIESALAAMEPLAAEIME